MNASYYHVRFISSERGSDTLEKLKKKVFMNARLSDKGLFGSVFAVAF
jgi:hypothetical protein